MDDFLPLDTTALTHKNRFVGVEVSGVPDARGNVQLWGPARWPAKGFWLTHKRRFNRWYGTSHLAGCWAAWRRLATRDGALEVLDGAMYRLGYRGPTMYYPPEQFQKKGGQPGIDYDAGREFAREFVEQAKAGASIALPNTVGEDKLPKWRVEWPESTLTATGILEW